MYRCISKLYKGIPLSYCVAGDSAEWDIICIFCDSANRVLTAGELLNERYELAIAPPYIYLPSCCTTPHGS